MARQHTGFLALLLLLASVLAACGSSSHSAPKILSVRQALTDCSAKHPTAHRISVRGYFSATRQAGKFLDGGLFDTGKHRSVLNLGPEDVLFFGGLPVKIPLARFLLHGGSPALVDRIRVRGRLQAFRLSAPGPAPRHCQRYLAVDSVTPISVRRKH